MLLGIPKIIPPELLRILDEMGHADELTIADANFPGHTYGKRVVRMDGCGVPEVLDAILQLCPLDDYVDRPLALMAVPPEKNIKTPIWDEYAAIVSKYDCRGADCFEQIERFAFYDRVREHSTVVIMTGETALNANIVLKKGVVSGM